MADRDFEIRVDIKGDTASLQADLAALNKEFGTLKSEIGELNRAMTGAVGSIRGVRDSAKALAVDLGFAERAMGSLTRNTRLARDSMMALTAQAKDSRGKLAELDLSTKLLADAQSDLARRIDSVVVPSFDRQTRALESLSSRMIMTGSVTNEVARAQREAAIAAAEEAAAINHLGDEAEITAAKLTAMRAAGAGRGGGGGFGVASTVGSDGGGGRGPDWRGLLYHRGSLISRAPVIGGLLGALLPGGLLPMLGLGAERAVTVPAAVVGSAGVAATGGAALGLGALGTTIAGGGSDAAVMKSTIADTKTLFTNYENLQQAVETYGAKSTQAANAQAQLNFQLQTLGPASQVELTLAKQIVELNKNWDQMTGNVRKTAVQILDQPLKLAQDYMPRVIAAAQRNLSIINRDIKPLFTWLEGPQGVGIFKNLENHFAQNLPTSIHAFTQAIELLLRITNQASDYTGNFTKHLDELFTKWNSASDSQLHDRIGRLVDEFRAWEKLLKFLALDLKDLFSAGDHEGRRLVDLMTRGLEKFNEWENSAKGKSWLHEFFKNRTDELLALFRLLTPFIKAWGQVYVAVQPLVPILTSVMNLLSNIIHSLTQFAPGISTALGAFLVFRRYFPGAAGSVASGLMGGGKGGTGAGSAASTLALESLATGAVAGRGATTVLKSQAQINSEMNAVSKVESAKMGGGFGSAVSQTIESGMLGSMMSGFQKIKPILKVAAAFQIGGAIIDGLSTAFTTKGSFTTKFTDGVSSFLHSVTFGLIPEVKAGAVSLGDALKKNLSNAMSGSALPGDLLTTKQRIEDMIAAAKKVPDGMGTPIIQTLEKIKNELPTVQDAFGRQFPATTAAMRQRVLKDFQETSQQGGSYIENMKNTVTANMHLIKEDVGSNSAQAKESLAVNFIAAANQMQAQYQKMGVSTDKAMAFINNMLIQALKAMGVPVPKSTLSLSQQITSNRGELNFLTQGGTAITRHGAAAQGGIFGSPNAAGRDLYHVVMGEGEAILTRHQRTAINHMLPPGASVEGVVGSVQTPHYAATGFVGGGGGAGGYVYPFGPGLTLGRTDMGLDMGGSGDIATIGKAHFTRVTAQGNGTGWPGAGGGGGAMIVYQLDDGPDAGRYVYLAENVDPFPNIHTGMDVPAGTVYAHARGFYPFLEEGWAADAGGTTAAAYHASQYPSHSNTPEGIAFTNFVQGLAHGKLIGGGAGGPGGPGAAMVIPKLQNYKIKDLGGGVLDMIAQKSVDQVHDAAQSMLNKFGQAGGVGGVPGGLNGNVMQQIFQAATQLGFNKLAIAGLIGNAVQESSLNPSLNDGTAIGLWQWDIAAGQAAALQGYAGSQHKPWQDIGLQVAALVGGPSGIGRSGVAAMNAQGSPAAAAVWFEQTFEKAGIPAMAHRIAAAQQAYAQGFDTGGVVGTNARSYAKPHTKHVKTTPHAAKSKKLPKVKSIPGVDKLIDGFQYYWDTHAVNEPFMHFNGSGIGNPSKFFSKTWHPADFAGGNSAALQQANDAYTLLQGMLNNYDDQDSNGTYNTNPNYIYKAGHFWPGDTSGNASGLTGIWKVDQQIAAQMAILAMMQGQESGSRREVKRLHGWEKRNTGNLDHILSRAVGEKKNIDQLKKLAHANTFKRSQINFGEERHRIHDKFTKLRYGLTINRLKKRFSLASIYGNARTAIENEERTVLGGIDPHLAAQYKGPEAAAIRNSFASALNTLSLQRQKASTTDQIGVAKAREFLSLAEQDALFAITNRQHDYTAKSGAYDYALFQEQQAFGQDKSKAGIIMNDLLAADSKSLSGKMRARLSSIGLTSADSASFGGTDILSGIKQTIADLNNPAQGIPYFKLVNIANLVHARDQLLGAAGGSPDTSSSGNATLADLQAQQLLNAQKDLAIVNAQLKTLAGFTPILGQMVGSFAKGGVIPETGYALVHRHETISPDPQGPYGTQTVVAGGGERPIQVVVELNGSLAMLRPYVEAIVDGRAQKVASRQTARRSRIISGAPGR